MSWETELKLKTNRILHLVKRDSLDCGETGLQSIVANLV